MGNIAIQFENISKQYRLGLVSTKTLSHDLNRWWQTAILKREDPYLKIGETNDRSVAGSSEYVWALRDINFKVEQGDVLGIIGKNGAGKSTLLKILSRVTTPTTGTIKARGKIASLLEVGTGFHPELTGRENIYMNGAIMGMTKSEISRKLDEIVEFAGVARYIDTPTKRYSSGMTVRLGFAIAAHLDPEILVVDEVLAVGDAEFQKKAVGKMQEVSRGEGRTVLFVSHNMESVKRLCKTGILLKEGTVHYSGNINEVINSYIGDKQKANHKDYHKIINENIFLSEGFFVNENNVVTDSLLIGEKWSVKIRFSILNAVKNIIFSIGVKTSLDLPFSTTWSEPLTLDKGDYEIDFTSDEIFFQKGLFQLVLGISHLKSSLFYDEDFLQFEVKHLSKKTNENLIRIDGRTGIIVNQLRINLVRI